MVVISSVLVRKEEVVVSSADMVVDICDGVLEETVVDEAIGEVVVSVVGLNVVS